jgi:hypothetical protein
VRKLLHSFQLLRPHKGHGNEPLLDLEECVAQKGTQAKRLCYYALGDVLARCAKSRTSRNSGYTILSAQPLLSTAARKEGASVPRSETDISCKPTHRASTASSSASAFTTFDRSTPGSSIAERT